MKKLVFMFVALAAISFASCGGNKAGDAAKNDSDSIAMNDSDSTKTASDSDSVTTTTPADSSSNVAK